MLDVRARDSAGPWLNIEMQVTVFSGLLQRLVYDEVQLPTFTCYLDWFGSEYRTQVVANEGAYPLLGTCCSTGAIWRSVASEKRSRWIDRRSEVFLKMTPVPLFLARQAALSRVYEDGSYMLRVHYERPCSPPLQEEDPQWAWEQWADYKGKHSELFG